MNGSLDSKSSWNGLSYVAVKDILAQLYFKRAAIFGGLLEMQAQSFPLSIVTVVRDKH